MTDFNSLVLIWPVALIMFVAFFFRAYNKDMTSHQEVRKKKTKRTNTPERPGLYLPGRPGRMKKTDYLVALAVMLVYGILAFSFSGGTTAPQTFWKPAQDKPLSLDLGETVQLDNIVYYTGLVSGLERDQESDWTYSAWVLELSDDEANWREQPFMPQRLMFNELFTWIIPLLEDGNLSTRYIRITAKENGLELGELALVTIDEQGKRTLMDVTPLSANYPEYAALFDEQSLIPDLPDMDNDTMWTKTAGWISDKNNSMVFDEVYHARTAYEFTRSLPPTELTHPPLGKVIIAAGIRLFGMTPLGWRFMGILFGMLMVPLFYVFVKNLFDNTTVALCGTTLLAFEQMHYVQSRLATIDTFVVFSIIAMYLFMYRYISSGYDTPFRKTLPALFLCGLCFGLGVATKWTGFYAALGLVVLYVVYLVKRGKYQIAADQSKEYRVFLTQTLCASVVCFVIIPFVIYTLSYIPYVTANGHPLTADSLLRDMWNNQTYMLNYHGDVMTDATHTYQSQWWEWILSIRPITYYSRLRDNSGTHIIAITNPLIAIGGLAALVIALLDFFRKRIKTALIVVVGYLAQLAPWALVPRTSFAYHYYPSVIFLTLAICYIFDNMAKHCPGQKWRVYVFTGVSVGLFFLFLPITAGFAIPDWYLQWFVRWLPSWTF